MKEWGFRYLFPFVDRPRKPSLRRQHHNVMGVGASLQFVFHVGCLFIALCCNGVDFWCCGGLLPDISSIKDGISVIITFWYDAVQGSRKFFASAQGEGVFSDGGCKVFEFTNTTRYLHLHLYTICKEPAYKGKLCATLDTFNFHIWL
jgi:hypothetical protein